MELITEELKAQNGPDGAKYGEVIDKETNEPVATYKKANYGKAYSVAWHPTFLALNPGVANSVEANSAMKELPKDHRGYRTDIESLNGVVAHAHRAYDFMASRGFEDKHRYEVTDTPEGQKRYDIYDKKSGEHLATTLEKNDYKSSKVTGLSKHIVEKHNVPESVVAETNKRLSGLPFHRLSNELDKTITELSKKKNAVGLETHGASNRVFHIGTSPEEASAAHEEFLKAKGYTIKGRHSPTIFEADKPGHERVTSIANGDTLHSFHVSTADYAKKTPNVDSF